jgi:indolepyruvate ferredoxin oxidoreductase
LLHPVELPLGRAARDAVRDEAPDRAIELHGDFSCLKGFCPSFVTVAGGSLRKRAGGGGAATQLAALPDPAVPSPVSDPFDILVTGVGGTGVVTIGALLGMAAHIEGYQVSVMDMTGAAQKGGAVHTHVRIADRTAPIHAVRIPSGGARLLLGCDLVVAAEAEVLDRAAKGRTRAILNEEETITAEFTRRSASYEFPNAALRHRIGEALGGDAVEFVAAGALTASLLSDAIGVNLFMLGYAWQKGRVAARGCLARARN